MSRSPSLDRFPFAYSTLFSVALCLGMSGALVACKKPEPAHNKPRFEDWAFIKTQVLVTGKISLEKEGRLRVEFKLWDVISATELSALAFYTRSR